METQIGVPYEKTAVQRRSTSGEPRDLFKALMESVSEIVFVIEPTTGRLLEANPQAASVLGYAPAELLALKADQIFSTGMAFFQPLPISNCAASRSGGQLVTKDGRHLESGVTAHTVAYRGQAAVLVIAYDAVSTAALASSGQASAIRLDLTERTEEPAEVIETTFTVPSIIGQSTQIRHVCRLIGLVAQTDTTVLIQGESGTGKELIGQALHFHSHRTRHPLVKVNCAALTETLLESELVGDSMTVRVDVCVIAITNTDLVQAIQEGRFREDLYYRLNAFPIRVPPLKERKEDIPLLAHHFLTTYTASVKKQIATIDPQAMALLMDYAWPGNVRELENTIEYAVILEKDAVLTAASLPDKLQLKTTRCPSLKERLELVERQMILEALTTSNGVKTRTAALLGIDPRNLGYFLQKHGIHT